MIMRRLGWKIWHPDVRHPTIGIVSDEVAELTSSGDSHSFLDAGESFAEVEF